MEQLPPDIDIVNLSLGGYTDHDAPPLAIATALQAMARAAQRGRRRRRQPGARAGRSGPRRSTQVLAVGAVDEQRRQVGARELQQLRLRGSTPPPAASNLQSTFARAKTKVAQGPTTSPFDPIDHLRRLGGVGRHLVRHADRRRDDRPHDVAQRPRGPAAEAQARLLATAPPAPQPDFPHAVLLDELEGAGGGATPT